MATPAITDDDLRLRAEAEAQAQFEFEQQNQLSGAIDRGGRKRSLAFETSPLGPSYNQGYGANITKGVSEFFPGMIHMASNAFTGADDYQNIIPGPFGTGLGMLGGALNIHPQDLTNLPGIERSLHTVGSLALGTAGGIAGGAVGAGFGGLEGAIAGGAAGFGAGTGAFDVATDSLTDTANQIFNPSAPSAMRPYDQYLKDMAYNTGQGLMGGVAGDLGIRTAQLGAKYGPQSVDTKVANSLRTKYPGIDQSLQEALDAGPPGSNNPLSQYKSTGELLNNSAMLAEERGLQSSPEGLANAMSARNIRNDAQLKLLDSAASPDAGIAPRILDSFESMAKTPEGLIPLSQFSLDELTGLSGAGLIETSATGAKGINPESLRGIADVKAQEGANGAGRMGAADVQQMIQQDFSGRVGEAQAAVDAQTAAVKAATAEYPPTLDTQFGGGVVRSAVAKGLEAQQGIIREHFGNMGTGTVPAEGILAAIDQVTPKYIKEVGPQQSEALSGLVSRFRDSLEGTPSESGLFTPESGLRGKGELITTPSEFNMEQMQALSSDAIAVARAGDKRSAAIANAIVKSIDDAVRTAVENGTVTPQEAASWKAGIEARKTQGKIYEHKGKPTKSVLAKEYSGGYTMPDTAVLPNYFKQGNKGAREAVQNFKEAYGNNPEAMDVIYRYATDKFKEMALNPDGTINASRANSWRKQYADAMKELPDLKAKLESDIKAQEFLDSLGENLKRTVEEVQKSELDFWLQTDSARAVEKMFSAKDSMVKRVVGTTAYVKSKGPAAIAAFRRAINEYVKSQGYTDGGMVKAEEAALPGGKTFTGIVHDAAIMKTWNRIRPALEKAKVYTDSQMKIYDYLYEDKFSQGRVDRAKPRSDPGTKMNFTVAARILRGAGSKFLRFGQVGNIMSLIAEKMAKMSEAEFLDKYQKAILDPRVARDSLNKATDKNVQSVLVSVFKDELPPAMIAATGASVQGLIPQPKKIKPLPIPKQHEVLSKKSFPSPDDLLRPPMPKPTPQRVAMDLSGLIDQQPADVQAQMNAESSYNPLAVSPKGALGLMQVMPATAKQVAGQLGEPYMPIDPALPPEQQFEAIKQNVRIGREYMNQMMNQFKNKTLAYAAYNAGPGRLEQAIKKAGTRTDVDKILAALPAGVKDETLPYIRKIMERLG